MWRIIWVQGQYEHWYSCIIQAQMLNYKECGTVRPSCQMKNFSLCAFITVGVEGFKPNMNEYTGVQKHTEHTFYD